MKFAIILLLLSCAASAQQDMGVITGLVTDPTGAAVPAARVTVTNRETGETRTVDTSDTRLLHGRSAAHRATTKWLWRRRASRRSVQQDIELHAQDRARADLKLEVGQIAESVSGHVGGAAAAVRDVHRWRRSWSSTKSADCR